MSDVLGGATVAQHLAKDGAEQEDQEVLCGEAGEAGHIRAGQDGDDVLAGEQDDDERAQGGDKEQGKAFVRQDDQDYQTNENTDQTEHCRIHTKVLLFLFFTSSRCSHTNPCQTSGPTRRPHIFP
ncbi:hypothetical protein SDC9_122792 [bioreactor metagenome]|uniref:Uncharacterized protein n=1 Tax=bioreactor metagenome TaxID=1076179 RepID=A0A645CFY1_9ZZZZ